jgi:hypothetical protein
MILTNLHKLPEPLVRAISHRGYDSGGSWRTVTELIGPSRISHLKRKHDHELTEDVVDRLYAFQGEMVHSIIERANMGDEHWVSEERIFDEIEGKKTQPLGKLRTEKPLKNG